MMTRKLLLYRKKDFKDLKRIKLNLESANIYSITPYLLNNELIEKFSPLDVIDISSISDFNNKQSIAEQVLPKFPPGVQFICDEIKWETFSYEMRFLFNEEVLCFSDGMESDYQPTDSLTKSTLSRTLFFYDHEAFHSLEAAQMKKGMNIKSISAFIYKNYSIEDIDLSSDIIDITSVSEFSHPQLVAEEYIPRFDKDTLFICDQTKWEQLEYIMRFTFKRFSIIRDNEIVYRENEDEAEHSKKIRSGHRKITDLGNEEFNSFMESFRKRLYGHSKFKDDFEEQLKSFRVFNKLGEHKILSLFLMGDSGVGKTEVARLIFDCMKGSKRLAKINFGNYSGEFSLSSLIGSARGYIGSEDGEIFMKVRDSDVGILLIDEFEKSNATLFNYFLDVLESGRMTGSQGQELDLNGFIIVFTSNISKEDYKKRISPELRSRFDYKCMFTLLGNEDKMKYVEFRANSIARKLNPSADEEFRNSVSEYLKSSVNVAEYQNMRDINKQIKKVFVQYLAGILNIKG